MTTAMKCAPAAELIEADLNSRGIEVDPDTRKEMLAAWQKIIDADAHRRIDNAEIQPGEARKKPCQLEIEPFDAKIDAWRDVVLERARNQISDLTAEVKRFRDACLREVDAVLGGQAARGFAAFFDAKAKWSAETFGPGQGAAGVLDHIRKELAEVEREPGDLAEWVDIILLAMDGARRCAGADGATLAAALVAKMVKNKARTWPDWRTAAPGKAIEHDRSGEAITDAPVRVEAMRLQRPAVPEAGTVSACKACNATVMWLLITSRGEVAACDTTWDGVNFRGTPHACAGQAATP